VKPTFCLLPPHPSDNVLEVCSGKAMCNFPHHGPQMAIIAHLAAAEQTLHGIFP